MIVDELREELTKRIIPFWNALEDKQYGGFYGEVDSNNIINKQAVKGSILNSRILWFYSAAAMNLKDDSLLKYAEHAYNFLKDVIWDKQFGGLFWSVEYNGVPSDDSKHVYNQAFGIYALSQYYLASGNKEALEIAYKLFDIIETKGIDEYGYLEQFTREFVQIDNEKLSENGLMAEKTMNTMLHVLEAYTVLFQADKNEKVADRMQFLLKEFAGKVYDPDIKQLKVFFDKYLNVIGDIHSFGHDIEGTWLLDRAADVLGDEALIELTHSYTGVLADAVLDYAYYNSSLANETDKGVLNEARVWWVQAEAMIGCVNAYQKTGDESYLAVTEDIWEFIKKYIRHESGEWVWNCDKDGKADNGTLVSMWKCPYHNSRMCMELMNRLKDKNI